MSSAKLLLNDNEYELPVVIGTENEIGIDIRNLRSVTKAVTLDSGYANTGSCFSSITFIDGENGILRHRGYAIEDLARHSSFLEVSFLIIYGHLPNESELRGFHEAIKANMFIHEDMKQFFGGFPPSAHPMSVLSSMVASLAAYYEKCTDDDSCNQNYSRLMAQMKTIAAFSYKKAIGEPYIYPRSDLSFASDFLNMLFARPGQPYEVPELHEKTLDLLFLLHADHTQNCSTSAVRMVGSSGADIFASVSAGVAALSGPLHGRANQDVLSMLEMIRIDGGNYSKYIEKAKNPDDSFRLMGFGHRVYKNFDPRARIIKGMADQLLENLGKADPLLDISKQLEEIVLKDDYFIQRKLYPNVDFYSGILFRAIGIPQNMYTVLFAIGRLPGWIANWKEMREATSGRIHRPRQIYTGEPRRAYIPLSER